MRNGTYATVGLLTSRGLTFALVVLAARSLTVDDYGLLTLVLAVQSLCLAASLFGFDVYLLRELTAGRNHDSLAGAVLRAKRGIAAAAIAVALLYLTRVTGGLRLTAAALVVAGAYFLSRSETHETLLAHHRRYAVRAFAQVAPYALAFTLFLPIVFGSVSDAWAFLLLALILFARELFRERIGRRLVGDDHYAVTPSSPTMRSVTKSSWPFAAVAVLGYLYARIDAFLILEILDATSLARYAAAYHLYTGLVQLVSALGPIIMQRGHAQQVSGVSPLRDIWLAIAMGVVVACIVGVLATTAVSWLYGDRYHESASVLRILALALPLNYAASVALRRCYVAGRERSIPRLLGLALFTTLATNVLALSRFGIVGAAWATVLTEGVLLVALLSVLLSKREIAHAHS